MTTPHDKRQPDYQDLAGLRGGRVRVWLDGEIEILEDHPDVAGFKAARDLLIEAEKGAAPSTEAPPISTEFAEFIGRLSDLAHTSSFWEEKPYGNRLYYGIGAGDYIAKDVLHAFLHAIKNAAPAEGDLTASGTSPATNPTEQPALPSATVPIITREYLVEAMDATRRHGSEKTNREILIDLEASKLFVGATAASATRAPDSVMEPCVQAFDAYNDGRMDADECVCAMATALQIVLGPRSDGGAAK